ncbi:MULTISPECIES: TetR/AcrR family transcriptional regulator [unclassified Mesorhizobium]|uniref:TetR/AcrR family transcriptional regulator n=1 Tax=unclassified Mesorhizobium TaxID=325217 RepID=UPI000FE730D0|nr:MULTISPECIES: TetR/AcrR family transcriptional regulator [unclassified Mesorhizobium]RWB30159.1 MAG: TetR/AcrR family transcriptional regulator [Mesorhizobium sp.]RWC13711.1 MAG: TetR/AcrR family transcriptional regulator [Mesorhizobium sp.]RWC37185.1 MAG: TetR/AcrR family transcriptional regulator [Mesorhizobium sp.]RWD18525.1 MAG: TetR/AcrR family transcriptional regulator [Mesorhizobium sp.]RWD35742.1 MAG: TetR/AcrR family transcriptional regulator [Mesorhizobium sp.]
MAGRPREFDRDQALEKARDAFWTRGYEGTSMADLVSVLGLASPRIYAAFGSKESLFREAVALYEANEGGFATRALAEEPTARQVIERMLREAVETYTRPGRPQGCMVVSAATNCAVENDSVLHWLAEHRLARTASIVERLKQGVRDGELQPDTDAETLGDYYATLMHGLSVQARDGVPKERLHALVTVAMQSLDARPSGKP